MAKASEYAILERPETSVCMASLSRAMPGECFVYYKGT
ncbi:hypothetical protein C8D92_103125 [Tamilnaduibacter salinus]|uniref:Uncharacterized protein n=1 Tax=Tamilnaduibacter salinus TaxID=1484056 RepID=A0A2U1CYI9_9GAMM|nr:hypothetical protein C8D92_103125 [Tamilnaduibacter salinus]